jgi:hypothetical protein
MPKMNYTCKLCHWPFDHPAGVDYLADGTRLLKCPHCEGQFEALPDGGMATHGVDPKEVV